MTETTLEIMKNICAPFADFIIRISCTRSVVSSLKNEWAKVDNNLNIVLLHEQVD